MPALWRILATGVKPSLRDQGNQNYSPIRSLFLLAIRVVCGAAQRRTSSGGCTARFRRHGSAPPEHSAEALYLQLRSVGLDKSRVYHIREVTLERAAFHITFDDGTIAFTEDVAGHVTGAFFEGEGEVLLIPNDQAERASMMLFTGAAILEEKFVTAYFRFNDDTFAELQPALCGPPTNSQEFVSQWDSTARNLAQFDALRLLLSFSNSLPTSGQPETARSGRPNPGRRRSHAACAASGTEARDFRSLLRLAGRGTNLGRSTEDSRRRKLITTCGAHSPWVNPAAGPATQPE